MYQKMISDRQSSVWMLTAMAAPIAQAASRCTWPVVLLTGGVCLLVCRYIGRFTGVTGKWLRLLQNIWLCLIVSKVLRWSGGYWPAHENAYGAPLILLILAAWLVSGGQEKSARVGCTLLWPVGILLGIVLLSGVPDIMGVNVYPAWRIPDGDLIVVMLIPILGCPQKERKGRYWGLLTLGVLVSVIVSGVLSPRMAILKEAPLYELSKSIRLLGIGERFESLIAAAMTLGSFVTISLLLNTISVDGKGVWGWSVVIALLFIAGEVLDSCVIAIGFIVLWVILPVIAGVKNNFQKMQKST